MTEFFATPTAKVYYDPSLDTLFLEYLNRVSSTEEFITINSALIKAFMRLNTQKFVADIRKMGVISPEAQAWVAENLFPSMIEHMKGKRLLHAQVLDPKEIFSKVAATGVKNKSKQLQLPDQFVFVQFQDEDEMRAYLIDWK